MGFMPFIQIISRTKRHIFVRLFNEKCNNFQIIIFKSGDCRQSIEFYQVSQIQKESLEINEIVRNYRVLISILTMLSYILTMLSYILTTLKFILTTFKHNIK